jgi:hypothetical protein
MRLASVDQGDEVIGLPTNHSIEVRDGRRPILHPVVRFPPYHVIFDIFWINPNGFRELLNRYLKSTLGIEPSPWESCDRFYSRERTHPSRACWNVLRRNR